MTKKFRADQIHLETTDQHALIGFAEKNNADFEYLVLLRKFIPSNIESDRFQNDKVYLEYSNVDSCGYGCVLSCNLTEARIVFLLDKEKCPSLPDDEIVIEFHSNDHRLENLETTLDLLLADKSIFNTTLQ